MIIKSMSRKEPSFGQLASYMSDDKSDRDFHLYRHVFQRDPAAIAKEFEANARFLAKRKNGNYLYHEILSLDTRRCGQGREVKEKLRLLALDYVDRRCPENMVFGAMHQDHEGHLHYHLMISANQKDDRRRFRLPKARFDAIQREMERQAIEQYPELKQERVIDKTAEERALSRDERKSQKQIEMEKRGARPTKKEAQAQTVRSALSYAGSQEEFERILLDQGFEFYQTGPNTIGMRPLAREGSKKKPRGIRFKTLGVLEDYRDFLDRVEPVIEDARVEGEKEKTHAFYERENGPGEAERDGAERSADNEPYVKYDSNADLKSEPASQQNPEGSGERYPQNDASKREPEPYTEPNQDDELSERQREWKAQAEERRVKKKNRSRDDQEREQ